MPEMVRPSERPARALLATPITLPMSRMEVAPTWAMISWIFALTSSGESCLGRYFSSAAASASSLFLRAAFGGLEEEDFAFDGAVGAQGHRVLRLHRFLDGFLDLLFEGHVFSFLSTQI